MSSYPASILVVDDRDDNLLAMRAILEPLGHHVVLAKSGEEALEKSLEHDWAVILLDVQMPGIDGFETARYLQQNDRTRYAPIIFLTAVSTEARNVFEGYSVGAIDYILKPFDAKILRAKVSVFVDLWTKQQQIEDQSRIIVSFEERDRDYALEQLRGQAERGRLAEAAIAMIDTPIAAADRSGRVVLWNAAAERSFGVPASDAIGRDIDGLLESLSSMQAEPVPDGRILVAATGDTHR